MGIRTDLAIEAKEIYEKENRTPIEGVETEIYTSGEIKVQKVKVTNEKGEKVIGKPIGTYVTFEIPEITYYDDEVMDDIALELSKTLAGMFNIQDSMTALVVGLGNWNVTPDALGPKVISKVMITRHLKQLIPNNIDEGIRPVCGISPGVLGITGIETGEIIRGVVDKVSPDVIICIDALASRKMDRVNRTIQIGNTGISPGSGVGNKRMEISMKTLGVPVIAIGVPTVVDAATMANDTIDLVLDQMIKQTKMGSKFYDMLKSIDKDEKQKLIEEVLDPYVGDLMVTPKDVDMVIDSLSQIIANGINIALQPALEIEEINKYIN